MTGSGHRCSDGLGSPHIWFSPDPPIPRILRTRGRRCLGCHTEGERKTRFVLCLYADTNPSPQIAPFYPKTHPQQPHLSSSTPPTPGVTLPSSEWPLPNPWFRGHRCRCELQPLTSGLLPPPPPPLLPLLPPRLPPLLPQDEPELDPYEGEQESTRRLKGRAGDRAIPSHVHPSPSLYPSHRQPAVHRGKLLRAQGRPAWPSVLGNAGSLGGSDLLLPTPTTRQGRKGLWSPTSQEPLTPEGGLGSFGPGPVSGPSSSPGTQEGDRASGGEPGPDSQTSPRAALRRRKGP